MPGYRCPELAAVPAPNWLVGSLWPTGLLLPSPPKGPDTPLQGGQAATADDTNPMRQTPRASAAPELVAKSSPAATPVFLRFNTRLSAASAAAASGPGVSG